MKKALIVVLTVVLVLAMAIPTFARGINIFTTTHVGYSVNERDDIELPTRSDWTNNHHGNTRNDVNFIIDDNGTVAAKVTEDEYYTMDFGGYTDSASLEVTLKAVDVKGFTGWVVRGDGEGSEDQTKLYHKTSGFGWTLLPDASTKIAFFVYTATGVSVYEWDTEYELGEDYHTYKLYDDGVNGKAKFYFDGYNAASFEYDDDGNMIIKDGDGNEKVNVTNAEVAETGSGKDGNAEFYILGGDDIEVYFNNMGVGNKFDAFPESIPLPAPEKKNNPATGDASIVAFIAVAACVALVVLKKKETI